MSEWELDLQRQELTARLAVETLIIDVDGF